MLVEGALVHEPDRRGTVPGQAAEPQPGSLDRGHPRSIRASATPAGGPLQHGYHPRLTRARQKRGVLFRENKPAFVMNRWSQGEPQKFWAVAAHSMPQL